MHFEIYEFFIFVEYLIYIYINMFIASWQKPLYVFYEV